MYKTHNGKNLIHSEKKDNSNERKSNLNEKNIKIINIINNEVYSKYAPDIQEILKEDPLFLS